MSALEDIHARAVKHHQAGELDRAELFYRQVLAADPGHARAWHLLGVLIHQQGDSTTAVEHIERALALDGTNGVTATMKGASTILSAPPITPTTSPAG